MNHIYTLINLVITRFCSDSNCSSCLHSRRSEQTILIHKSDRRIIYIWIKISLTSLEKSFCCQRYPYGSESNSRKIQKIDLDLEHQLASLGIYRYTFREFVFQWSREWVGRLMRAWDKFKDHVSEFHLIQKICVGICTCQLNGQQDLAAWLHAGLCSTS